MHQKVHRRVGRCPVDRLASLDFAVTVDQSCRTTRYGSLVCLHLIWYV